jgi:undecaprenyl pyrophosphate phosphatase UppP
MEYQVYNMLNPGLFKNQNHGDEFSSLEISNLFTAFFVAFLLAWIAGLIIYDFINKRIEQIKSDL